MAGSGQGSVPTGEGDQRYRAVLATIDEGFCVIELMFDATGKPDDFRFLEVNAAFERHTGMTGATGRTIRELIPDIEPAWIDVYGEVVLTGVPQRFVDHAAPLGRWFDVNAFPIGDTSERRVGLLFTDITSRRAAERALHEQEERLRLATCAGGLVIWEVDVEAGSITYTDNVSAIVGFDLPRSVQEVLALVEPIDLPDLRASLDRALADRTGFRVEHRLLAPATGEAVWLSVEGRALDEGRRFVGVARNVTAERAQADAARAGAQHMQVLVAELQHRTRNLLAVVRAVADKTIASAADLPDFRARFRSRLDALARVNGLLSRLEEGNRLSFDELVRVELAGHGITEQCCGGGQVVLEGPEGVRLRSSTVQIIALGLHELITNAVKYGALSRSDGRLRIAWTLEQKADGETCLRVDWRETGVALSEEHRPAHVGYGRELIERALPYQLKAETCYTFGPDGVCCTIALPVPPPA